MSRTKNTSQEQNPGKLKQLLYQARNRTAILLKRLGVPTDKLAKFWRNERIWTISFVVGLLLIFTSFVVWVFMRPGFQLDAIRSTRTNLQTAVDDLNKLQPPRLIELGQRDTTLKFQTDELIRRVANPIPAASFPPEWAIRLNVWRSSAELSYQLDVDGLNEQYNQIISSINNLYDYHLGILLALKPVFEYNPVAEFAPINPNSDLFARKIDATVNEVFQPLLEKVDAINSNAEVEDPELETVKQTLQSIISELNNFKQHKDLAKFAKVFNQAGEQLVASRQSFWTKQLEKINNQAKELDQKLVELEAALQSLN